jgi:hypothetical protein
VLENVCGQAKLETQEERECRNEPEHRVGGIFEKLPNIVQGNELSVAEKIDQIVQAIK